MRDVERVYAAINGWESARYGWKGTGHVTEVQCVRGGRGAIAGTITFVHKSGRVQVPLHLVLRPELDAVYRALPRDKHGALLEEYVFLSPKGG
jgi:hypothetical protein